MYSKKDVCSNEIYQHKSCDLTSFVGNWCNITSFGLKKTTSTATLTLEVVLYIYSYSETSTVLYCWHYFYSCLLALVLLLLFPAGANQQEFILQL